MIPPSKILFATDLSSRSDRAFDRAISLAKLYDCELTVLHVLESPQENNSIRLIPYLPFLNYDSIAIERARRQILDDMEGVNNRTSVLIEKGKPHEIIMRVAEERDCDLIITGVARNEILGRCMLGNTVEKLLRKSKVSLVVVTEKFRGPYRKIAVSADLSPVSMNAVEAALLCFPDQAIAVVHAFTAPKSSSADNMDDYREQMRHVAYRDLDKFIATADMTSDQRDRINMIVEYGNDIKVLKEFVRVSVPELVVVGLPTQGLLSRIFLGDHAKRLISSISCDIFIVRQSPAGSRFQRSTAIKAVPSDL